MAFVTLRQALEDVVGADEAEPFERRDAIGVIPRLAGLVPTDVVVEVAGDD